MLRKVNIPLTLLSALCVRMCATGGNISEALTAVALCALYGLCNHIEAHKQKPLSDEIIKDIADLKTTLNAVKLGRSLSR